MTGVDNRIVSMTFDNESFERKLSATLDSLDKLTESLSFAGTANGFSELSAEVDRVDFSSMLDAVENISSAFSALGAIGFTVLQDITRSAVESAQTIIKTFSDPLLVGGKTRALNIENAKFAFRGLGIDVEAAMESARLAVTGTAFGLDVAAKAAAQFGASGISAGADMTQALRGIAGAAAISNTSFEEIADIFTSAAATGTVNNNDLQRFATRGLNATAALGKQLGLTELQVKDLAAEGKLSFDVFSKAMDDAFGEHATKANETYTGALANMKAALARIGAAFFGPVLIQQRDLFNALAPVIDKVKEALLPFINTLIRLKEIANINLIGFIKNFDVSSLIKPIVNFSVGIINVFGSVVEFVQVVKEAFRDIFPVDAGKTLLSLSEGFRSFTEKLKMGGETADKVKSIFRGIFSILSIGFEIIKGVAGLFIGLFSSLNKSANVGSGGILSFFANLGESLVTLKEAFVDGGGIADFFKNFSESLQGPIQYITALGGIVFAFFKDLIVALQGPTQYITDLKNSFFSLFNGGSVPGSEEVSNVVGRLGQRMEQLSTGASKVSNAWQAMADRFKTTTSVLGKIFDYIANWFSSLGSKLAAVFKPGDFNSAVDIVNVGLLGGIALLLKKFSDGSILDLGTGIIDQIKGAIGGLTDTLKAMQLDLKAKALIKIAIAVGLLTASILVLSLIDSAALTKALVAISVGFTQLVVVMNTIDKSVKDPKAAGKIALVAAAMILLSAALLILAVAVKILSTLSLTELAKGLGGIVVLLATLVLAINNITVDTEGLIKAGIAMIAISVALLLLSLAVRSFAGLSITELGKGLLGVAGGLAVLVIATREIAANTDGLVKAGIAMIAISVGLIVLSLAVRSFSSLSLEELGRGFIGIAGGLGLLILTLQLMPDPKKIEGKAASILVLSIALNVMAFAVAKMGSLGIDQIVTALGAFAALLFILSKALDSMKGAEEGAAALIVASAALYILAKVLTVLGQLSIEQLILGLAAIAATLLVLGVAAYFMTPVIPTLQALGIALSLIGLSFALFGVGAILVAKAFEALTKAGKAGAQVLIDVIKIFVAAMPEIIGAFVNGLLESSSEIFKAADLLVRVVGVIIGHILDTIIELAPKFADAFGVLISAGLEVIGQQVPAFIDLGLALILALLDGIQSNIGEITTTFVGIIIEILNALTESVPELVQAGVDLLVALINGITNSLDQILPAVGLLIAEFILQLGAQAQLIVDAGFAALTSFLQGVGDNLGEIVDTVFDIATQFITDVGTNIDEFLAAGAAALVNILQGIADDIDTVVDTVFDISQKFIEGVATHIEEFNTAGTDALVGILDGLLENGKKLAEGTKKFVLGLTASILSNTLEIANGSAELLISFLDGFTEAVNTHGREIKRSAGALIAAIIKQLIPDPFSIITLGLAGAKIVNAIADGMIKQFSLQSIINKLKSAVTELVSHIPLAVRKFLHIESPSKVFEEIGSQIPAGLVVAFNKDKTAEAGVVRLASRVTESFNKSLSKIDTIALGLENLDPVITPVIDLTNVNNASKNIDKLIGTSTITPAVSFDQAQTISSLTTESDKVNSTSADEVVNSGSSEIKFEQNIYAPEALTVADIYRNTKGQIALAKEELKIS